MSTPEEHSLLGASSAERWLHCTPSVRACELIQDETSEYAEEGKLAHSIGELKVQKYTTPMKKSVFDNKMKKFESHPSFQAEMHWCTDAYLNKVKDILSELDAKTTKVALELRVDYSAYAPDGYGTGDCVVTGLGAGGYQLHVADYKHGKGVAVSAHDNTQLKLYALGTLLKIQHEDSLNSLLTGEPPREITVIYLHIIQPRTGEGSSSFSLTVDDLLHWAEHYVRPRALLAYNGQGEFTPGHWCKTHFCPLRGRCRAQARYALGVMFHEKLLAEANQLTTDEVAELLSLTEELPAWRKALVTQGYKLANSATGLPGYKIVGGRTDRVWKNDKKVAEVLSAQGIEMYSPPKLLSPAQIEGLLGKEKFAEAVGPLVEKGAGKPTLVPESDRRVAVNHAADDFKDFLKGKNSI